MQISGYRPTAHQGRLWSEPLGGHGHCRTILGEVAQEATAALVGGRQHKTQGNVDYCPDVSAGQIFYECKAVGSSSQAFVCAGRLEKDRLFAADHTLIYALWHHRARIADYPDDDALRAAFYATLRGVYLVPFAQFAALCAERPVEKLNSQYGKKCRERSPGDMYGQGIRLQMTAFAPWKVR